MYRQQALDDSQPYFAHCNPILLSLAGLRVHQGEQQINMNSELPCLTPLVTVKVEEKLVPYFTCLI